MVGPTVALAKKLPGTSMGIWDLHGHLATSPGRCTAFDDSSSPASPNDDAGATPEAPADNPEARAAALIACADRMGVERQVLFCGMDMSAHDPSPAELRRANDECMRAVATRPDRLFGFVYLSPSHTDFSLAELERCVRAGPFVGVKLWVARRCDAREIDPIIRRAAALKAVIYQHTWIKTGGNGPGESTPADLVALAARHPTVPLICGHSGGNWELGIRAVRASANVLLETAGNDPTAGLVEMAVRELGAARVVYGSDVGGRSYASQIAKVTGAGVPEHDKRLILRENLRRLLGPILAAKGVRA
jgi:predicted TIM-barrel fold metal-dependent hydrolase